MARFLVFARPPAGGMQAEGADGPSAVLALVEAGEIPAGRYHFVRAGQIDATTIEAATTYRIKPAEEDPDA